MFLELFGAFFIVNKCFSFLNLTRLRLYRRRNSASGHTDANFNYFAFFTFLLCITTVIVAEYPGARTFVWVNFAASLVALFRRAFTARSPYDFI